MVRALSTLGALAVLLPLLFQAYPATGAPVSQEVDPTNPQDVEASGNAPDGFLTVLLGLGPGEDGQPQSSPLSPGDAEKGKGNNGKGKGKGKGKHGGTKGGKKLGNGDKNSTANENAKAVYFITNDATNGNAIVAMKVGADGKLSDGSVTKTGGKGGIGIQKGAPAAVDPLFSQSAVRVGAGVSLESCLESYPNVVY
jgi:hypothetical protein